MNIAEILKDCPKGTKLYSPLLGECEFKGINQSEIFVEQGQRVVSFNKYGKYWDIKDSECLLFPSKENRDWSTFQRHFKDGDVVVTTLGNLAIVKDYHLSDSYQTYCFLVDNILDVTQGFVKPKAIATEEERQKLFDAIKANGYKWNEETKTLEKLVEPKFNVGDKIVHKENRNNPFVITDVTNERYKGGTRYEILIEQQDNFELVSDIEPKFKVGDRIKEKQSNIIGEIIDVQKNKYNVKIDDKGLYLYFREQDNWELVPNKFDITTLKPFESKVLVRDSINSIHEYDEEQTDVWRPAIWGVYVKDNLYPFGVQGGCYFNYCIPYENNEHLLGTTNDCDEFYKNW